MHEDEEMTPNERAWLRFLRDIADGRDPGPHVAPRAAPAALLCAQEGVNERPVVPGAPYPRPTRLQKANGTICLATMVPAITSPRDTIDWDAHGLHVDRIG